MLQTHALTRRHLFAIGLLALAPWTAAAPANAQDLPVYTYVQASPSAVNSYPVYMAISEGYFRDEGFEISSQAVNGSSAILQALASGQAHFGRPGPSPVIMANARGEEMVFIYSALPRSSFGILVPEQSEAQTPEALKGATIGVGTADGAEVGFARTILASYGFEENKDYSFIPVGDGGSALAGIMRGDIAAYVGGVADLATLNYRGMPMRDITPEEFTTLFGNGYTVKRSFMEENPKVVEGFVRALLRGNAFARDPANREKVMANLREGNPQESEDAAYVGALFDVVLSKGVPHVAENGFGYNDPAHWQIWHDSLVEMGDLAAPLPDLSRVYSNEFLQKGAPQ